MHSNDVRNVKYGLKMLNGCVNVGKQWVGDVLVEDFVVRITASQKTVGKKAKNCFA